MLWRRSDGALATVTPERRVMPHLAAGRNGSVVYADLTCDLTRALPFLAAHERDGLHATPFHLVVWALARVLARHPHLNRFVTGGRIFDRDGVWIAYSAKKRLADGAPIVVVKERIDPSAPFAEVAAVLNGDSERARSDERTGTDVELSALGHLPVWARRAAFRLVRGLDGLGLLPDWFIRDDPMFASAFVANLGSVGLDAGYHHLYEYGSISIFCVLGRQQDEVVAVDGAPRVVPAVTLRFTYDERIEDGLYARAALDDLRAMVEDPARYDGGAVTRPPLRAAAR